MIDKIRKEGMVQQLGAIFNMYNMYDVASMTYLSNKSGEWVVIVFTDGRTLQVNVNMEGHEQILKDILGALEN